jgi:methionine-rich copper-binding protein CopC
MVKKFSRPAVRLLASLALSLTLVLACFGIASAQALHAKVVDSDPKMGSTVAQAPSTVTVTTAENMKPGASSSNLFVYGPSGELISQGDAKVDLHNPKQMSVAIKSTDKVVYVVQWKTVSADDGDPDQGAFTFTVGTAASAVSATNVQPTPAATQSTTTASSSSSSPVVPIVTGIVALLVGLGAGFGLGRARKSTTPNS